MNEYYLYGVAAAVYLTTCWCFAAVRWFHTCKQPKENHRYIWPDRKLQCLFYLCSAVLIPYVIDPTNQAAWMLEKWYFPTTYYFYCSVLLLCYTGTVKQWNSWKNVSWIAAIMVIVTMIVPILNAWLPTPIINDEGLHIWHYVTLSTSIVMLGYVFFAMWQVRRWIIEARDANYSNPDDFPVDYANRVWLFPIILTPLLWPAYIFDSPLLMAVQNLLLAVSNICLLITVMPLWRRMDIPSHPDEAESPQQPQADSALEEMLDQTAVEIEAYVREQEAYLDSHLTLDDVAAHTQHGRTYASLTFQRRFGGFASYVNGLRLAHYERYCAEHPGETKESAALSSGFSSYNAYYRAKQKVAKQ